MTSHGAVTGVTNSASYQPISTHEKKQENYTTPTSKKENSQLHPELWKIKPLNNSETKILWKWKCKTKMAPEMNTQAVEN